MGLESIVNPVVTSSTATPTQEGFGTPLLLGGTARAGTDLLRYYSTLLGVGADYASTTPEYKAATRMLSQSPRPPRIAIAKRTNVPTQSFTFTVTAASSTRYAFRVGTGEVEFTSDSSATAAEIYTGLVTAFDALPVEDEPDATFTNVGPGTSVKLTADAPGTWLDVEVLTPSVLAVVQDQVDAGVTADLNAIYAEQRDWYGVVTLFPSQAEVLAISAWVEANRKLHFFDSVDTAMRRTPYDPEDTDDTVGGATKSRNYARSILVPQLATGEFAAAATASYFLATLPGSTTLHLKQLVGVRAMTLTETEETNLKSYNANVYVNIAGLSVLLNGVTSAGTFVDLARDTDWLVARTKEDVFTVLAQPGKVPYTDPGVTILTAVVAARAQLSEAAGFLAPGWKVTALPVASVSSADRAARRYPAITLTAPIQGAIHSVDPLTMTLYV